MSSDSYAQYAEAVDYHAPLTTAQIRERIAQIEESLAKREAQGATFAIRVNRVQLADARTALAAR